MDIGAFVEYKVQEALAKRGLAEPVSGLLPIKCNAEFPVSVAAVQDSDLVWRCGGCGQLHLVAICRPRPHGLQSYEYNTFPKYMCTHCSIHNQIEPAIPYAQGWEAVDSLFAHIVKKLDASLTRHKSINVLSFGTAVLHASEHASLLRKWFESRGCSVTKMEPFKRENDVGSLVTGLDVTVTFLPTS